MKAFKLQIGWLCFSFILSVITVADASPSKPLFPSILTYASFNEISKPGSDKEWQFEASHIDMGHGGDHFAGIKSRSPDTYFIKYRLMITTIVGTEDKAIASFCKSKGYEPEDAYLHYYDDTVVQAKGGTKDIPGWKGGSAKTREASRITSNVWDTWRYSLNLKSACVQEYMKMRSIMDITKPDRGGYVYSGIFIDEASPIVTLPKTLKGGGIIEYGNRPIQSLAKTKDYAQDVKALFSVVSVAMKKTSNNQSLFFPNTASYAEELAVEYGLAADGMLTEFMSHEKALYSAKGEARLWDIASTMAKSGKIYILTQGDYTPPKGVNYTQGNYRTQEDRHEMYSLSSYWMAKEGNFTYYSLRPRWKPLSSFWVKAQEFDLGNPAGPYYVWKVNPNKGDSAGQKYKIYRRDYTKAVVIFRTRSDWDPKNTKNFGASSEMYDLGETFRVLFPDGTLGPAISKVSLCFGEGVVLIPANGINKSFGTPCVQDTRGIRSKLINKLDWLLSKIRDLKDHAMKGLNRHEVSNTQY